MFSRWKTWSTTILFEKIIEVQQTLETPIVNFINILQAAFVPIFLHAKK